MARRGKGEGSLYQRKDGRWVAQVTTVEEGRRVLRSYYAATREAANKRLKDAQKALDSHLPLVDEGLTVERFLSDWLAVKKGTLRAESWRRYDDLVRLYIMPELGRYKLARLDVQHVQRFHAALKGRVSGTTAQLADGVLRTALRDAERWGKVSRNVAKLTTAPRRSTAEMRYLGPQDARALLAAAKGDPLEAFYVTALMTGLRLGELQALRWRDIDLLGAKLHVTATLTDIRDGKPVFGRAQDAAEPSHDLYALAGGRCPGASQRLPRGHSGAGRVSMAPSRARVHERARRPPGRQQHPRTQLPQAPGAGRVGANALSRLETFSLHAPARGRPAGQGGFGDARTCRR